MRCPYCKTDNDRVIDSRSSADGFSIRRRRVCRDCARRYTTYERVEGAPLRVVKKSGERVEFDRRKILAGLLRAVEKRPVSSSDLDRVVDSVEQQVMEAFDKEVPSRVLGELIMSELQSLDQVAYVRFASVYREFKDVSQFLEALEPMLEPMLETPGSGETTRGAVTKTHSVPPQLDPDRTPGTNGSSRRADDLPSWKDVECGGIHEETG